MKIKKKKADPSLYVSYLRVSTGEQADSGLGLEAQRAKIRKECERRDWTLVHEFVDAGVSGGVKIKDRPNLTAALDLIEKGEVAGLIVAKLDRLSRRSYEIGSVVSQADEEGWSLVSCDMSLDMSTPNGKAMSTVMSAFAELEKDLISQRTKEALQAKKAQGHILGRPDRVSLEHMAEIVEKRRGGYSLRDIARYLNDREIKPPQGGKVWYPGTIAAVLRRAEANN